MNIPIIDGHIHMNDTGGPIIQMYGEKFAAYRKSGFNGVCIVCDTSNGLEGIAKNPMALLFKALSGWRQFFVLTGLDYFVPGQPVTKDTFMHQAEKMLNLGSDGFKMYEGKPNARKMIGGRSLLDPAYDSFFALLEERSAPVVIHMGDPESFWDPRLCEEENFYKGWFFGDSSYASLHTIQEEILTLLKRYPKLRIVVPQLAFLPEKPELLGEWLEQYPNLYFDLGPTPEIKRELQSTNPALRDLISKWHNRILFSCTGVCPDGKSVVAKSKQYHELLLSCGWEISVLDDIFNRTFRNLFPNSSIVDKDRCIDYCQELISQMNKLTIRVKPYEQIKLRIEEVRSLFDGVNQSFILPIEDISS